MSDSKYFDRLLFSLIFLIFAVTFIIYGYRLVPDSYSYMAMNSMREPLYPFFLFIFRSAFKFLPASLGLSDDAYLYAVSIFTNLLTAYAVYFAVISIKRLFKLNNIITAFIALIMLLPFFMSMIFSITGVVISCSIWTEGLTVPLYYIYFTLLIKYILNHETGDYVKSVVIAVILALTRGQMMVLFIVNLFAGIAVCHKNYKNILKSFLVMIASFIIMSLTARCYFYVLTGRFIGNTYGPVTTSTGFLLIADESHAELFKDKDIKELYMQFAQEITKKGYRENLYNGELLKTGYFTEAAHDPIKGSISGPGIYNYLIEKKRMEKGIDAEIARDKIASEMTKTLFPAVIKKYLHIYAGYLADGFIRSVAFIHPVLNIYALCVYVAAVFLLFTCLKKHMKREFLFMFFTLLALTGCVTSVSLVIMPLSRYMIYNLPFFYSALTVCLVSVFKAKN